MSDDRDIDADAHLREALRHAPDAELQPPAALSEIILRQARALAAPAPPPIASETLGRRLNSWWRWLTRPAVAAGFASLMVSTLVGLMWWDRPLDEALPPRAPPAAEAPVAAPTAPPPATPAPPPAPSPAIADAAVPTPKRSAPVPAAPVPERKAAARRDGIAAERPAAPATADAMESVQAPAAMAEARQPESIHAPAAPAAPAAPQRAEAAAPAAPPAPAPEPQRAARMNAAPAADMDASRSLSSPRPASPPALLAGLRAEIAAEPARWVWRRDAEAERPMSAALLAWLGQFDTRVRARDSTPVDTGTASTDTTTLRLLRDGQLRATLTLGRDHVRLDLAGESTPRWQVSVPVEVIGALKQSLPATGP